MCDTMVVVEPGRVLFAKNSARDPNEAQLIEWHPGRGHPTGARLRCTQVSIPQVERTNAVLLSRPWWAWGAEMGTNEHGLTIGVQPVWTTGPRRHQGLLGIDLVRLALERAATAEEAVEVVTTLLSRHGQGVAGARRGGHHASLVLADRREAWVVETAGDRWATERVRHGVRAVSTSLTIPALADEHADPRRAWATEADARRERCEHLARRARGVRDLMAALRDHGLDEDGAPLHTPRWSRLNGAMAGPCMHAGGLVTSAQVTGSWVAELRPDGVAHWTTGTAAPCTGLFKPVAVDHPVPLGPSAEDRYDPRSPWWRHEVRHRRLLLDLDVLLPDVAPRRDALEERWLATPPPSSAAFALADELLDAWVADAIAWHAARDTRPSFVRRYWDQRDQRAGVPDAPPPSPLASRTAAADHA